MVKKIKSELTPLTRELAERFAKMSPLPGERTLRTARVKFFQARLADETFNSPSWSLATIGDSDHEFRADGQHTSHALTLCGDGQFPTHLSVTINTYRLDAEEDRVQLFDLFDNPNSARTNLDKMGIFIANHPDLTHIEDRGFLNKVAHGIDYHHREANAPVTHTARDFGVYYDDDARNRDFANWLYGWHDAIHAWMVGKPGIVAEIYADWISYPALAGEFWGQVFTESNPDSDDETRELSRTLKEWSRKQPKVKQDKFRVKVKKIWDRFRRMAAAPPAQGQQDPSAPAQKEPEPAIAA